ncbi:Smad nuclear-interacting protein 1 [Orchesella cincta]|uniref:Smad nuclear-interacting protein 1 n=1 Tax=Orchesella cincta TaxID=48709 RepID=A0A1D2N9N8_ORCCI|nr:Smad nuclear-interacting protein 1 [Orchesella cincta]
MSSDWRNVRIKEEPVSDIEGNARSHRSQSRGDHRDRREGGVKRDRRDRHSPSPPPTHSKHKLKGEASGSPGRDRNRRDRSRSRDRTSREPYKGDRDRRRQPSRERRERDDADVRRIKREPRSRSRSPPRQERRRDDRDHTRDHPQPQSSRDGNERPRDGKREQDWNNFFNPNSDMSKQAVVKREKEEQERKEVLGEDFGKSEEEPPIEKEQPNFGLSGKLTEESNTFRGVVIKYAEPPEARKPNKIRWRLYPFKGEEALPVMYVHRQSAFLLGRDRKVADIPVDHPSCSKQHAVLQYRLVPYLRPDGSKGRRIKPYILDLESANGTFVNGKQIEAKRYVELFEKDVLKFGFSSREYVLLHEQSKDIQDDSPGTSPD